MGTCRSGARDAASPSTAVAAIPSASSPPGTLRWPSRARSAMRSTSSRRSPSARAAFASACRKAAATKKLSTKRRARSAELSTMMEKKPVMDQINLVVEDMAAAVDFYRHLGVTIPEPQEWPPNSGALHAEADTPGGARFELDNRPMAEIWHASWRERSEER